MAKRKQWPPRKVDYAFVQQLRESLTRQYAAEFGDMARAEAVYDGNINLGINLPPGVPRHTPSTAQSKVDGAASHIITDHPRVSIPYIGHSARHIDRRDKLTTLGQYFFDRQGDQNMEEIWAALKMDFLLLGAGCIKFVFDETMWPEAPEEVEDGAEYKMSLSEWRKERQSSFPFIASTVHPGTVCVPLDGRWPHLFAIETQERTNLDMWTDYPTWKPSKGTKIDPKDPMAKVEWVEYHDCESYMAWADGVAVFTRPQTHKMPPYIRLAVERGRKGKRGKGLLNGPVMSEIEAEARLTTTLDALWQFVVFARLLAKTDEASAIQNAWNQGPGGVLPVQVVDGPNKSVGWLEMPQLNPAMFQLLPTIAERIRSATFDPALVGQRTEGVDYGVHQALLIGQARQALRPFLTAMNRMASNWVNMTFAYMEDVLDEDINVGDAKIGPSVINGYRSAKVVFEATTQEDDDRRVGLGLNVLAAHAIPHKAVLERYFKSQNPTEDLIQLYAEDVIVALIQSGALTQAVMRSANMEEAETSLEGELQQRASEAIATSPNSGLMEGQQLGGRLVPGGSDTLGSRGESPIQG